MKFLIKNKINNIIEIKVFNQYKINIILKLMNYNKKEIKKFQILVKIFYKN